MKYLWVLVMVAVACVASPAKTPQKTEQNKSRAQLEKHLWNLEQQWLAGEHGKKKEYLQGLWTSQFFDILPGGQYINKEDMLNREMHSKSVAGGGAFPRDFRLRAVYGNVALATDSTTIKFAGPDGKLKSIEVRGLRMFVKEKGEWHVAGAALVPIPPKD